MSGGSYDYAYTKVSEMAYDLVHGQYEKTLDRTVFASLLEAVSDAMHAVEWVDSGDCSPPHDSEEIRRCLEKAVQLAKELGIHG